jgi:hypothetical protein
MLLAQKRFERARVFSLTSISESAERLLSLYQFTCTKIYQVGNDVSLGSMP